MKSRVCVSCHKEVPLNATKCPHCDFEFQSRETTLRCPTHGTAYNARVTASGEVISGHCPLCMENEDEEFAQIDRDIAALQKKMASLSQMKKEIQLFGFDLRLWGILFLSIAAMLGMIIGGGFIGGGLVAAFAAAYLLVTFIIPSLPLSPQWIVAPKQAEIQKKIKELTQKKKSIIQRGLSK
jgi:hypothetical protein